MASSNQLFMTSTPAAGTGPLDWSKLKLSPDQMIVTNGTGAIGPAPVFTDNRPTIVEMPLAIDIAVTEHMLHSSDGLAGAHAAVNASKQLTKELCDRTRCGGCERATTRIETREDFLRMTKFIQLTAECTTHQKLGHNSTVVCPDGRVTKAGGARIVFEPDLTEMVGKYTPEPKVSDNPDVPKTAMDDTW